MSMNATDSACRACATFRATVDLPDPDPPAIPMIKGFISPPLLCSCAVKLPESSREKKRSHCHNLVSGGEPPLASSHAKEVDDLHVLSPLGAGLPTAPSPSKLRPYR